MLPFGVTIPATVPQGSEIPEGLMNNPVLCMTVVMYYSVVSLKYWCIDSLKVTDFHRNMYQ